jgi:transposase-like protein
LALAVDQEPATGPWQSTLPRMAEAVELYSAGYSLNAISLKLGIAWDSVARLLNRAGVRERKNKSR